MKVLPLSFYSGDISDKIDFMNLKSACNIPQSSADFCLYISQY